MKLKITRQNYLLYLVVFALILLLFFYLLSDKDAIVRQLYKEFYGASNPLREGIDTNGLDWTVYKDYTDTPIIDTTGKQVLSSGSNAYGFSSIYSATNGVLDNWSQQFTIVFKGYFIPDKTGWWTFGNYVDDSFYMWISLNDKILKNAGNIGDPFLTNWCCGRYAERSIFLVKDQNYAIRIQMSQGGGPCELYLKWKPPLGSETTNGSGLFFSVASGAQNALQSGLTWRKYPGYFNDDIYYTSKKQPTLTGRAMNTHNLSSITNGKIRENVGIRDSGDSPYPAGYYSIGGSTEDHDFTLELTGFFYTNTVNTDPNLKWKFLITSDDASYLWIGNNRLDNGGGHGMLAKEMEVALEPNQYYPIRIIYGEGPGAYNLRFIWKPPGGNWTGSGDGYFYIDNFSEVPNDHYYSGGISPKT